MTLADAFAAAYREQPVRYATKQEMTTAVANRAMRADHLPSLVYADWLEENGQPERAAFIRRVASDKNFKPTVGLSVAGDQRAVLERVGAEPGDDYLDLFPHDHDHSSLSLVLTAPHHERPDWTQSVRYAVPMPADEAKRTVAALHEEGVKGGDRVREHLDFLHPEVLERPTQMKRDGDPAIQRKLNSKYQKSRAVRNRALTPAELAERIRALVAKRPRSTSQLQSSLRLDAAAARAAIEHGERAGVLKRTPTAKGTRVEPHSGPPPHTNPSASEAAKYAAYRAPEGGVAVRGVYYPGGQLVPDLAKFAAGSPKPKSSLLMRLRSLLKRKPKPEQPLRYAKPVAATAAWSQHPQISQLHTSSFTDGGGNRFEMEAVQRKPGHVMMEFSNLDAMQHGKTPTEKTGTGRSHEVFANVASRLSGYLHEHRPHVVHFSATETEPSRVRLYHAAVKRAEQFHPDYVGYTRGGEGAQRFALVHKDHAAAAEKEGWKPAVEKAAKYAADPHRDAPTVHVTRHPETGEIRVWPKSGRKDVTVRSVAQLNVIRRGYAGPLGSRNAPPDLPPDAVVVHGPGGLFVSRPLIPGEARHVVTLFDETSGREVGAALSPRVVVADREEGAAEATRRAFPPRRTKAAKLSRSESLANAFAAVVRYSTDGHSHEAFHHSIYRGHYTDRLPALVYADWLEENGQNAHAEIVRRHQQRAEELNLSAFHGHAVASNDERHVFGEPTVESYPLGVSAGEDAHLIGVGYSAAGGEGKPGTRHVHFVRTTAEDAHRLATRLEEEGVEGGRGARIRLERQHPHLRGVAS